MKYQNIIAYGSMIAGLLGCEKTVKIGEIQQQEPQKFFASVPTYNQYSELSLTNGDFDGDGDLDIIVGTYACDDGSNGCNASGKIYLFLNDGKGNFTLKEPAKK